MANLYGAPPESDKTRPALSIVIAVGQSSLRIAQQVRNIYLRGDSRRKDAVAFYQLLPDNADGVTLTELPDEPATKWTPVPGIDFLEARRKSLRSAVAHAGELKKSLEIALFEQRIHENTIYAGWADKLQIWLNVFILGNARDPWAAGLILPFGAILNQVLPTIRLSCAHWLLDIATFPDSDQDEDLAVFSFLQAFDAFLQPSSSGREELAKAMNTPSSPQPDWSIYLFASHKEGSALVKSQANLDILMGNALLALLEGEIASGFFTQRDRDIMERWAGFYSSVGVTAVVYDPDTLQLACAGRCAHSFIQSQLLCPPFDGQKGIQLANQIQEKLGSIFHWLETLTSKLPLPVGKMSIHPDLSEMTAHLTDLHFSLIDYEKINQTPWRQELQDYEDNFQKVSLPLIASQLAANQKDLRLSLDKTIKSFFDTLPLQPELYPGGVQNARSVLELVAVGFKQTTIDLKNFHDRLPAVLSAESEKLNARRNEMEKMLSGISGLPWWGRILPAFARKWAAMAVMTLRYGHKIYLAQQMQAECISLLQQICGLRIAQQAVDLMMKIPVHLQNQASKTKTALTGFETKLSRAMDSFPAEWDEFPLGEVGNGHDDIFRRLITDRELAEWSYAKWLPNSGSWTQDFISAKPLFADWRTIKFEDIAAWVKEKAALAYQPVWTLTLEDIFALWANGTDGFPEENRLSPAAIRECMLAAIPPARPNFDAVGGSHGAAMTCHGVVGDPEWKYCTLPLEDDELTRWELITSADPYILLCMNVHHNFSLQSLVDSFKYTHLRLENLPPDQRRPYDLLLGLEEDAPPPH